MKEQLENRLSELKSEYETGQQVLVGLGEKQAELRSTLLRISGAIQVLEELMKEEPEGAQESAGVVPLEMDKAAVG